MSLTITIKACQLYSESENRFYKIPDTTIELEHSLVALSKWESKWHKPFLTKEQKTREEAIDYIRCMCITPGVDDVIFMALGNSQIQEITKYIDDPMSATTINNMQKNGKSSRETVTSELIYFWMNEGNISSDCENWHLNRLFKLIEITAIKRQPDKKMNKRDIGAQNRALNAARRARHGSKG